MDHWIPISRDELEELVSAQLTECSPEHADQFARLRVPFRTASIMRAGVSESVFIVAQLEEMAIYYEDVEDGFNVSEVAPDGSIATPGFEQWTIADAIQHLLTLPYDYVRRGPASFLPSLIDKVRPGADIRTGSISASATCNGCRFAHDF